MVVVGDHLEAGTLPDDVMAALPLLGLTEIHLKKETFPNRRGRGRVVDEGKISGRSFRMVDRNEALSPQEEIVRWERMEGEGGHPAGGVALPQSDCIGSSSHHAGGSAADFVRGARAWSFSCGTGLLNS